MKKFEAFFMSTDMSLLMDKQMRRFVQPWEQQRDVQFLCIRLPEKLNFVCWHLIFQGSSVCNLLHVAG